MNQGRARSSDPARDSRVCADVAAETPDEVARALRIVKRLYAVRRQRDRAFGRTADVFRDPAWDMMLELFAAGIERRKISVSSAAHVACIPQTTAIRLVDQLVARKLLRRVPDPDDGRRTLLELTPMARDMMWGFLATLAPDQIFDVVSPLPATAMRGGN